MKLKDMMNEVYKEQHFSERKKRETLQKARHSKQKRTFHWLPIACMVGVAVVLLVLIGGLSSQQLEREFSISSTPVPYNANTEIINRVEQFYDMMQDGMITDDERRGYTKTSDWLVQRALESGNSIFYNRPNITTEQAAAFNALLFNMYQFISTKQDAAVIAGQLPLYKNYNALIQETTRINELLAPFVEGQYVPSINEKPTSTNAFLNAAWWVQGIVVVVFLLVCYAFYLNWQTKRRRILGFVQLFLIFMVGAAFFKVDDRLYGYDETSVSQSMNENLKRFGELGQVSELLAAAEFEGARYGFARLDDGRLVLDSFYLEKDDYLLKESSIIQADSVMMHSGQSEVDGYKRIVGIADNSGISKYELLDTETGESYSIDVDPHKANIYQLTVPRDVHEMEIHIYDEQGRIDQ